MNKFSKFFSGFAALAMLAACTNDEPAPVVNDGGDGDGSRAFMTIRLQDASQYSSRATEDGGYENAVAAENDVNDARFFFFDKEGVFVQEASVWNDGDWNTKPGETGKPVEFKGNTVIVLENLTQNNYPEYLLTVLNAPDFKPESTIQATAESLQMQCLNPINGKKGNKNYFVMSTSSYYGEKADKDDKYYYANHLTTNNFLLQPVDKNPTVEDITDATKIVDVYVERLAAKVQLDQSTLDNETSEYTDENGVKHTIYKVNASVAGNPNDQGGSDEGVTDVYIDFLGWDVNATAKNTYLSKQLLESWKNTVPFTGWSAAGDSRCFWAKSWVYDKEVGKDNLNYTSWSMLGKKINATANDDMDVRFAYCNENTNTVKKITENGKVIPANTTSVLVKARACDKNGKALDLVRHSGLLYNKADYIQYVLNSIDMGSGNLNVFYQTKETRTQVFNEDGTPAKDANDQLVFDIHKEYAQIDSTYAKLDRVNGKLAVYGKYTAETLPAHDVTVVTISGDSKATATTVTTTESSNVYYSKSGSTYTAYADAAAVVNYLSSTLSSKQSAWEVEAFTGGAMYYNIPIEHLAAQKDAEGNAAKLAEGYYGVVRNHWYRLDITSLVNVGYGVFNPGDGTEDNPGDPIIPNKPDPDRYYLAAKINILSWKIVNQNVPL